MSAIALTQNELDEVLSSGYTSIILCDNNFLIPRVENVTYTVLGTIQATADFSSDDAVYHNINFIGFTPVFSTSKTSGFGGYGIDII